MPLKSIRIKSSPAVRISNSRFTVRPLHAGDSRALREIRLESLLFYGALFTGLYNHERSQPDSYWRKAATPTNDHCYFGLFDGTRLVGIVAAKRFDKSCLPDVETDRPFLRDHFGKTALWWSAYIRPGYRHQGVAEELYKAREKWTRQRFKIAEFFIHRMSKASIRIHQKQGAKCVCIRYMRWQGSRGGHWFWMRKRLNGPTSPLAL
jgi:GNAT superfamily N-acetyltransferase